MDIFGQYKSPLGYQVGENQIDTYGVDHSGFSTRDEVAYQTARQQRENQIMQNYHNQGINKDYPQYGTDFWGHSSENNYGFGASNITPNVENMQNTLPDVASDVSNMSSGNFSAEALKERMIPVIRNMEEPLDYIYIDTTWNKTTGAGANIDDWDTFNQVNWVINGHPATKEEKRVVFNIFQNEINQGRKNKDSEGNIIKNNKKASSYIDYSQFRLAEGEKDKLLRNHLTQDVKYLQKEFPDFASYPPELQNVLLDIKFNTGNVSQENWPKLRKAIAEKNLFGDEGIIHNVHRKDVGEDRNYWAEQQIRNIKSW